MLGNNSLSGELPLWTGFPKAQLFGLSNNSLDSVLPDRWAFPELSQLQVCLKDCSGCPHKLLAWYMAHNAWSL